MKRHVEELIFSISLITTKVDLVLKEMKVSDSIISHKIIRIGKNLSMLKFLKLNKYYEIDIDSIWY